MTSTLFQNILPEDIPVMLKRLNAYTKSYQKEEYIKHAGDPADFIGIIETGSIHVLQEDKESPHRQKPHRTENHGRWRL